MSQTARTSDALNLEALQKALEQLDTTLPESLQQQINQQLNQLLVNPQPQAVDNLLKLALEYEPLSQAFFAIHEVLSNGYQANKKDKGYTPTEKETPPTTTPNTLDNTVAPPPTPAQANTTTQGQKP
jgi:hypothetical protein